MAARQNEYHPEKSQVAPDDLAAFIAGTLTGDLTEIPGVGPKTAELFGDTGGNRDLSNELVVVDRVGHGCSASATKSEEEKAPVESERFKRIAHLEGVYLQSILDLVTRGAGGGYQPK